MSLSLRMALVAIAVTACTSQDPELGTSEAALVDPSAFVLPSLTAAERAVIVHKYAQLDPTNLVPRGLLEDAIVYFDVNQALIPKTSYFVVVDLSQYSGKSRFWLVDLTTGAVETHKVAHGAGSDPDNDGYATLFGNVSGSNKSSLGFFLTGEIYDGTHPHSMRIDGLSPDGSPNGMANTNVRARAIVMHEATYVSDANSSQQGRSDGCFALDPGIELSVVDRIHDGSLIYAAISPLNPPVGPGTCGDGTCTSSEDKFSCPEDCGPCGTIDATGGTIDNGDACFVDGGPAVGLHQATGGMGGSLVWTHATALTVEQDFAEWSFNFAEAGRYSVEVYTAAAFAQSKQASYVVHAGTTDQAVTIDQTAADGYQSLGEFDFAQGAHQFVHLGDNTGEHASGIQLVFDAVRLTRIDDGGKGDAPTEMPSPPGGGGGCSTGGGAGLIVAFGAIGLVGLRRRPY
jgi:hypothetical protein